MLTRLLTIVPLLLCPLLMLVCMWAMRGMGNRDNPQGQAHTGQQELPTAAQVAQLERELAELRGRFPQASPAPEVTPVPRPDPAGGSRNGTPMQPS